MSQRLGRLRLVAYPTDEEDTVMNTSKAQGTGTLLTLLVLCLGMQYISTISPRDLAPGVDNALPGLESSLFSRVKLVSSSLHP